MREETRIWINKAEEDFQTAGILISVDGAPCSSICFHCQQSAEKLLKALLVEKRINVPKTHDLILLIDGYLTKNIPSLIKIRPHAEMLTDYAVSARYPDFLFHPSLDDAKLAYSNAEEIRQFVINYLLH